MLDRFPEKSFPLLNRNDYPLHKARTATDEALIIDLPRCFSLHLCILQFLMSAELTLCIPGPWKDRREFLHQVVLLEPTGSYLFAGGLLAHIAGKDHTQVEFFDHDPDMGEAFRLASQGKISRETLERITEHKTVVYLHFPLDIRDQRERVLKFTQVLQRMGGYAVKIENSGVAHEFEEWYRLLGGNDFNIYCSVVNLIADQEQYYSCGMHHFKLPECAVSRDIPTEEAADLMNQFNFWQVCESPVLQSGHTFSLSEESPHYRLIHSPDLRHHPDDLFHNSHGVWNLELA